MTTGEIESIIAKHEMQRIELKESFDAECIETACAFANVESGMKTSMKTGMKTSMKTTDAILGMIKDDPSVSIDMLAQANPHSVRESAYVNLM